MIANASASFFVRNENGRGFKPTKRGVALIICLDVVSWIVAGVYIWSLIAKAEMPIWFYGLLAIVAAFPFCVAMFLSGKGPLETLIDGARRMKAQK